MNERIQELARQCYYLAKPALDEQFDKEKFAELLIKECTTKMALEIMNNSWVDDAVKSTYQHFGVE